MNEFFKENPRALHRVVTKEQEVFIKLMVEDSEFLFRVIDLIDQNWFEPFELRDIVRTLKDIYNEGGEISYDNLFNRVAPHYDVSEISKEISLEIIKQVLEDCKTGTCIGTIPESKWKENFINRLIERRY